MSEEPKPKPKAKGALSKEFMHVPMWGWIAGGLALLLGLYYFTQQRNSAKPSNTATGTDGTTGSSVVPYPFPSFGSTSGTSAVTTPSQTVANTKFSPADWVRNGSAYTYKGKTYVQDGIEYFKLEDPGTANAFTQGGGQAYFFPAPGAPQRFNWGAAAPVGWTGGDIYGGVPINTSSMAFGTAVSQ